MGGACTPTYSFCDEELQSGHHQNEAIANAEENTAKEAPPISSHNSVELEQLKSPTEIHHHHHHYHNHYYTHGKKDFEEDKSMMQQNLSSIPPVYSIQAGKPFFRISCKTNCNYFISIKEGKVILVPYNPSDDRQRWFKEEKHYKMAEDEAGQPAFALVNRATNQALKHSFGHCKPVQLVTYDPYVCDESILWTHCKEDLGDGYRSIRMINNTDLSFDAFASNINGATNGTEIILFHWNGYSNQQWIMTPSADPSHEKN